jgi:Tfp pilus assembly protein PilE
VRNRKGFLLLEVIVSIVVLASGLVFISRVYSASKGMVLRSRELFEAALLMEEAAFGPEEKGEAEEGASEGAFVDKPGYKWSMMTEPVDNSELGVVTVNVLRGTQTARRTHQEPPEGYSFVTYLKRKAAR